jgi:hypothetical protein
LNLAAAAHGVLTRQEHKRIGRIRM